MKSNRLDILFHGYAPIKRESDFSTDITGWSSRPVRIWGERRKWSSRQSFADGDDFPLYSADFNVRWEAPAEEKWRLVDRSQPEIIWEVETVEPNRRLGMKTLHCTRVNI